MTKTILEYSKMILEKVSFDIKLLEKEYKKAVEMLSPLEIQQLNFWVNQKGMKIVKPIYIGH